MDEIVPIQDQNFSSRPNWTENKLPKFTDVLEVETNDTTEVVTNDNKVKTNTKVTIRNYQW